MCHTRSARDQLNFLRGGFCPLSANFNSAITVLTWFVRIFQLSFYFLSASANLYLTSPLISCLMIWILAWIGSKRPLKKKNYLFTPRYFLRTVTREKKKKSLAKLKPEARLMVRDAYLNTLHHCCSGYRLATEALSSPVINMKVKIITSSSSLCVLIETLSGTMVKNTGTSGGC